MKKTLLSENKKKLEAEKKQLTLRLAKIVGSTDDGDELKRSAWTGYGQKSDENAAEVAEYANTVSLEKSSQDRLQQIDAALLRIANNSYGTCEVCGNNIEEARLEAMPTATTCLSCSKKK